MAVDGVSARLTGQGLADGALSASALPPRSTLDVPIFCRRNVERVLPDLPACLGRHDAD